MVWSFGSASCQSWVRSALFSRILLFLVNLEVFHSCSCQSEGYATPRLCPPRIWFIWGFRLSLLRTKTLPARSSDAIVLCPISLSDSSSISSLIYALLTSIGSSAWIKHDRPSSSWIILEKTRKAVQPWPWWWACGEIRRRNWRRRDLWMFRAERGETTTITSAWAQPRTLQTPDCLPRRIKDRTRRRTSSTLNARFAGINPAGSTTDSSPVRDAKVSSSGAFGGT